MKIFGPKRDEVTGEWTRLRNDWLDVNMEARRCAYRVFMSNPEGK